MLVTYDIQVNEGGNAIVTAHPEGGALPPTGTTYEVEFKSNDSATLIEITSPSPFTDPAMAAGKIITVGSEGAGPFTVVNNGTVHHLKCGFLNAEQKFASWGGVGPVIPKKSQS